MALIHHEGGRGAVPGGEGGRRVRHAQPAVGEGAAVGFALEQTFVRQAGLAGWQDVDLANMFGDFFVCWKIPLKVFWVKDFLGRILRKLKQVEMDLPQSWAENHGMRASICQAGEDPTKIGMVWDAK